MTLREVPRATGGKAYNSNFRRRNVRSIAKETSKEESGKQVIALYRSFRSPAVHLTQATTRLPGLP
jgi:hypothetical protein